MAEHKLKGPVGLEHVCRHAVHLTVEYLKVSMLAVMHRLRAYHALLAVLAIAAFLSAEWGRIHAWFGYGVAAVIVLRLALALSGAPQLGLMRFYPHFEGMKLGNVMTHPAISRTLLLAIAISLLGVTGTGIAMDRGRAMGLAGAPHVSSTAMVGATPDDEYDESGREAGEDEEEGVVAEVHEPLANLLVLLVGLHVSYLLLFKRPLARFMLFVEPRK